MAKHVPLVATLAAFVALGAAAGPASPASATTRGPLQEVRGIWVVCDSLASPQAVRNVVREARSHHFNTLFVQVRSRGDAWYRSDIEPRAQGLADQPASFDPLAMVIAEGHRNGLRVHAWMNTFLVWSKRKLPKDPRHIMNAHRDWVARDRDGRYQMYETDACDGCFLQPSSPAVRDHLFRVFTDVASRYDLDGIHFDFVRYAGKGYDFAPATLARFARYMAPRIGDAGRAAVRRDHTRFAYVHVFPREWANWRRAQVTKLVARICTAVHKQKPWLQTSAAVFANMDDAMTERGQDWATWLRAGYLDAVCPMAYSRNTDVVARQIAEAVKIAGERHVYAGLGSWRLSPEDTAKKIARVRSVGAKGVNIFSYGDVTHDGQSMRYLDRLSRSSFASRAGFPPMNWLAKRKAGNHGGHGEHGDTRH